MGVVYEVLDRDQGGRRVALKTLHRENAEDRRVLKSEFRVLSDIGHPNLVTLYELHADDDVCFFTMELVDGASFLDHVRVDAASPGSTVIREGTLRDALRQLAMGVRTLHDAGILHRDLKPSNVRVARDGRVVILDFGLAKDSTEEALLAGTIAGTPAYMAPEQALGRCATTATDWYGFGAIMHEALTGEPPFRGKAHEVLAWKRAGREPLVPQASNLPDLEALCLDLLKADPNQRPEAEEVLLRLGESTNNPTSYVARVAPPPKLVGRDAEMDVLRRSLERVLGGTTTIVRVSGDAGIGKSALVTTFLRQHAAKSGALILTSRCHERERLPYRAFDGMVDALAEWLESLEPSDRAELLPWNAWNLARVFPVLSAIMGEDSPELAAPADREARKDALRAFGEILDRISLRRPVVLHADDVHWADPDSAVLLEELLAEKRAPFLFIVSHRTDVAETDFMRTLASRAEPRVEALRLEPLGTEHALRLAQTAMVVPQDQRGGLADRVARESRGSPFLIGQLASYLGTLPAEQATMTDITVSLVVRSRVSSLDAKSRELLEFVSLAGRPLPAATVLDAMDVVQTDRSLDMLERLRLVQRRRSSAGKSLEVSVFHDRIGEAVSAGLAPERTRKIHARLADALVRNGHDDHGAIGRHYESAGDVDAASRHLLIAARAADTALAFARAAELYRSVLDLGCESREERRAVLLALGTALVNAGRGVAAAAAFREAAEGMDLASALDLRRRAAEQLLIAGRIGEGLRELRGVLASVNVDYPARPVTTVAALIATEVRLRIRGLDFGERSAEQIPAEELLRVDSCRAVAWPLSMVDLLRGALFDARHLLFALDAGEPQRIAVALVSRSAFVSTRGIAARKETLDLLERARRACERSDDPYHEALFQLLHGLSLSHFSEWQEPLEMIRQSELTFSRRCTGVTWELDFARSMLSRCLGELGRWREQSERLEHWLQDAKERGDDYFGATLRVFYGHHHWILPDAPERAREEIAVAARLWPSEVFNAQRLAARIATGQVDLYVGRAEAAFAEARRLRRELRASPLRLHQVSTIMARNAVAAGAIAWAECQRDRKTLLAVARSEADALRRIPTVYTASSAELFSAAADRLSGRDHGARQHLEAGVRLAAQCGRQMLAAAGRRQLGRLLGGDEGKALVREADDAMEAEGIRRPERIAAMLVPGFGD
jgi:tetratricopeptide (TPR) repeat protein